MASKLALGEKNSSKEDHLQRLLLQVHRVTGSLQAVAITAELHRRPRPPKLIRAPAAQKD